MPEKTLKPTNVSHSLGISLGATEIIYLLGLTSLAAGISLRYGFAWALIAAGAVMLFTAFRNAAEREKGNS